VVSVYFCSRFCSPGPRALSPFFESKFARLQYAGNERFNLAYFRHTERKAGQVAVSDPEAVCGLV
jgi:hypothetical protein